MHKKFYQRPITIFIFLAVLALAFWLLFRDKQEVKTEKTSTSSELLQKANGFDHAHGLAVDRSNPDNLYIATHDGLYLLKTGSSTELFSVGVARDDYMGFTAHPSDGTIFFSSGHPRTGGNIGFQKSTDSGKSWQKVSGGLEGPVDFHTMTVSFANPDIVYGSFKGKLQRSTDGGKNWEAFPLPFIPVGFATDKADANLVYAASPQGLFKSEDQGKTWKPLADSTKTGQVSALAMSAARVVMYSEKMGMSVTDDEGQFVPAKVSLNGATPLYADFSPSQNEIGYLITETHSVFKTEDGGKTWNKIYEAK